MIKFLFLMKLFWAVFVHLDNNCETHNQQQLHVLIKQAGLQLGHNRLLPSWLELFIPSLPPQMKFLNLCELYTHLIFTRTWPLIMKSSFRRDLFDRIIIQQHLPASLGGWKELRWVKILAASIWRSLYLSFWRRWARSGLFFFFAAAAATLMMLDFSKNPLHCALICDSEPVSLLQPKMLLYRSSHNLTVQRQMISFIFF